MKLRNSDKYEKIRICRSFTICRGLWNIILSIIKQLKSYKRGVLSAIFSKKHRFNDKCGNKFPEWESKKFLDVFIVLQNNTFSRSELVHSNIGIYNVHYGDILIKFGAYIDFRKENVPRIKREINLIAITERNYLKDGDVVFADTAEDYSVGKVSEIFMLGNNLALSGLHTIPCRPKIKFAPKFLGYYFNSSVFRKQILPLIQGTKVSSISKSKLLCTKIQIPKLEEQQKISELLSNIDIKIDKANSTLEFLLEERKSLLQKIFI